MNGPSLLKLFSVAAAFSAVSLTGCATHPIRADYPQGLYGSGVSQDSASGEDTPPSGITRSPSDVLAVSPGEEQLISQNGIVNQATPGRGQIKIMGEVTRPGQITFHQGADLSFYVSKAGGTPQGSDISKVQIIRGTPGKRTTQVFALDGHRPPPHLQGGDIVIVHADKASSSYPKGVSVAAATLMGAAALLVFTL